MWFHRLLWRIAVLVFVLALPFLFWPPPVWLIVACTIAATLIVAFGLLDPRYRLQRALVAIATSFSGLALIPAVPEVTETMVGDPTLRDWANFLLQMLRSAAVDGRVLLALVVMFLAIAGLEALRLRFDGRRAGSDLRLSLVRARTHFFHSPVANGHVIEVGVTVTNNSTAPAGIVAGDVVVLGVFILPARLARVREALLELGPGERIVVPPGDEVQVVLTADADSPALRRLLAALDGRVGRLIPLPCAVRLKDLRLGFGLRPAPGNASRR
jgi:hypothetical protein